MPVFVFGTIQVLHPFLQLAITADLHRGQPLTGSFQLVCENLVLVQHRGGADRIGEQLETVSGCPS